MPPAENSETPAQKLGAQSGATSKGNPARAWHRSRALLSLGSTQLHPAERATYHGATVTVLRAIVFNLHESGRPCAAHQSRCGIKRYQDQPHHTRRGFGATPWQQSD